MSIVDATIQLERVNNRETWDSALTELPLHHILQSWAWGEFKARWNWEPTRLLWRVNGEPAAGAQMLRRAIPGTPFGMAYVAKGPVVDPDDEALVERVLADIEAEARRLRCAFVKIDADVPAGHDGVVPMLHHRGWRPSSEQIQFRNTAVLDITSDEETLLMDMHSKTRYNIRYAGRKGVVVEDGTLEDLPVFYEMYAETSERHGFLIRPVEYYLDVWRDFMQHGLAHVQIAYFEEEPLAGQVLFHYGDTIWYFYGASRDLHRNKQPTYLLQWEAIRWGKSVGATTYDMWGAPDVLTEDDELWGVWRFKRGFNAEFREQIGAWDYPVTELGYKLLTDAIPRVRDWWRDRLDNETTV